MDLRDLVRKFLKENDLTYAFFARKLKIDKSTLSRWLNGERELSEDVIYRIKILLNGDFVKGMGEILEAEEYWSD